jgi:hypothetical protein
MLPCWKNNQTTRNNIFYFIPTAALNYDWKYFQWTSKFTMNDITVFSPANVSCFLSWHSWLPSGIDGNYGCFIFCWKILEFLKSQKSFELFRDFWAFQFSDKSFLKGYVELNKNFLLCKMGWKACLNLRSRFIMFFSIIQRWMNVFCCKISTHNRMLLSCRPTNSRPFGQNQCFKLNFNESKFKKWKLNVFIFDIKLRMQTIFKSRQFYSYFKVVADYRITGRLLVHWTYHNFIKKIIKICLSFVCIKQFENLYQLVLKTPKFVLKIKP